MILIIFNIWKILHLINIYGREYYYLKKRIKEIKFKKFILERIHNLMNEHLTLNRKSSIIFINKWKQDDN